MKARRQLRRYLHESGGTQDLLHVVQVKLQFRRVDEVQKLGHGHKRHSVYWDVGLLSLSEASGKHASVERECRVRNTPRVTFNFN